jgi:hypothetical protein
METDLRGRKIHYESLADIGLFLAAFFPAYQTPEYRVSFWGLCAEVGVRRS